MAQVAQLQVAVDASQLEILFQSPAANIVGFEHAPANPEEERALAAALAKLRSGTLVLRPDPAAGCTLQQAEVEHGGTGEADGHDPDHGEGHHHHRKSERSERPAAGSHSDFRARYRFDCQAPERLETLGVDLLREFPGIETLEAQVVTPERQYGTALTRERPDLPL